MIRYVVINAGTGIVENSIMLDDFTSWTPPDGHSIVQSDDANIGWALVNGALVAPAVAPSSSIPPPPTPLTQAELAAAILVERERRLSLGFDYTFPDARGTHRIGTTDKDMVGWDEVTKSTQALIALGQSTTAIDIVTNTGPVTLTAIEWQSVLLAAMAHRKPIWFASFTLQAMTPIPADYAADHYWTPA